MTKFNPERCAAILESIKNRLPYAVAARAAGVSDNKLYAWLRRGLADLELEIDSPKAQFAVALNKIEHDKIKEHMDAIALAPERWQAHAWILERRWWREFSPNGPLKDLQKIIERLETEGQIKQGQLDEEVSEVKNEKVKKERGM